MKTRRRRSDSAAAAVAAAQAAAMGPLPPPDYIKLRPCDLPYWEAIMLARARETWTEVDLISAATMARSLADMERLQADVEREGDTITAGNGNPIINPKVKLLETLSRRTVSFARFLHVHAIATVGRPEDAAKANELERESRAQDEDELIPTLRMVKR
jgi:hypothetical protein